MDIDLEELDLKELNDLRSKVDRAISNYETRRKRAAMNKLEETAREYGFSLTELAAEVKGGRGGPVAPKYANPADSTVTWTGRGRQPVWVREHLEAGGKLDDLAI